MTSFRTTSLALCATLALSSACAGAGADRSRDDVESGTVVRLTTIDSIASPAGQGSAEPNLAAGPDGRIWLSWLEPQTGGVHTLRVAVLEGDRWSEPRTVASGDDFFVNWADFPSVLPLGDGRLAAHWLQRSGSGRYAYDVRLALSGDEGRTWSESVLPHRDGTQTEHGFASLWRSGDGVAAVWLDGRRTAGHGDGHGEGHDGAGAMTLMSTTIAADAALGPEQLLDDRVCDCCQTTVAMTSRGPVVLYRDRSEQEIRDIAAVRHVDGRWTQPVRVHGDEWEIAACPVNGPAAAARGEQVVAAWFTGAQDTARVRVAFSADAGATWSSALRVDEGDPLGRVGAVMLEDGSALVSWLERTGGEGAAVRVRSVSPQGALGEPTTIAESRAARSSGFPRMARSGETVLFAWTEAGTPSRVRVARALLAGGESR